MLAFALDDTVEAAWTCIAFDPPWNGWASPVVDLKTLEDLSQEVGWSIQMHGSIVRIAPPDEGPEDGVVLRPDRHGFYHLRPLGWTFVETTARGEVSQFPARK